MRKLSVLLLLAAFPIFLAAENRALIVGIGQYGKDTGWRPIHGDADVGLLTPMLAKQGFTDIETLVNEEATKQAIVRKLEELAARCMPGDKVYFHFSGHGQPIEDANGDEEKDFDESIVPYDAHKTAETGVYEGQNHLIDDEYNHLLNTIKKKLGASGSLFVAIDACYSRGMERGEDTDIEDADILKYTRGTDDVFWASGNSAYLKHITKPRSFDEGAPMTIVSACKETERNYEYKTPSGKMYGSLTYCIYTLLKTDADFMRWRECFQTEDFRKYRIFQISQHPSVVVYP